MIDIFASLMSLLVFVPIFNLKTPFIANDVTLPALPPPVGELAPNYRLTVASYIVKGQIIGPETLAISDKGIIYTGLMNGDIISIDPSGTIQKIVRLGDETDDGICNDLSMGSHPQCGRPMGLRIKPNTNLLYVTDAYYGIFKIDLDKGIKTLILNANDSRFGDQPMKLVNDLDFDGDVIYLIDSSDKRGVNYAVQEILESFPFGRLFKFDEKTNNLELLLSGLYFPNGLQLMPDKQAILINECTTATITKFYVTGPMKGQREMWAGLPGHGDTIRLTESQTILVPMAISRYGQIPSVLDVLGPHSQLRTLFGMVFNVAQVFGRMPKYGLVVEYDLSGRPLRSWHDPTGKQIESVSNAVLYKGKLYLGSIYNDFIGVVDY